MFSRAHLFPFRITASPKAEPWSSVSGAELFRLPGWLPFEPDFIRNWGSGGCRNPVPLPRSPLWNAAPRAQLS